MQTKPFIPSSRLLLTQIAAAEAKFEASREQAILRKEARESARRVQAERAAVDADEVEHYAMLDRMGVRC